WFGAFVVGALIGVATLVRPLGLLYLPAALMIAWPRVRPRAAALLMLVLTALLPPLGWAARNQSVGEGLRVSTVGDVTLLYYVAGYGISEEQGKDWLQDWPLQSKALATKLKNRVEPGEDVISAARRLALEEIQARPTAVARVLLKSQLKLWVAHS